MIAYFTLDWLFTETHKSTIRGNKVMTKHSLSPNNLCFRFSLTKILRDKLSLKAWKLQPKTCWDNLMKNKPFLLQIAASHTSIRYNIHLPPVLQSKLYLQVLSMVLYCWHYWLGEEGDHKHKVTLKQTIKPKISYSVSSIFATGCSSTEWSFCS